MNNFFKAFRFVITTHLAALLVLSVLRLAQYFYLHDFGVNYEQIHELKDGCYVISYYLGDWYIDKCAWASKSDCKSQAASIKKFYKCMLNHGLIGKEDYQYLVNEIKENQEEWLETIERYDDWLMGDSDDDFDWYDDED